MGEPTPRERALQPIETFYKEWGMQKGDSLLPGWENLEYILESRNVFYTLQLLALDEHEWQVSVDNQVKLDPDRILFIQRIIQDLKKKIGIENISHYRKNLGIRFYKDEHSRVYSGADKRYVFPSSAKDANFYVNAFVSLNSSHFLKDEKKTPEKPEAGITQTSKAAFQKDLLPPKDSSQTATSERPEEEPEEERSEQDEIKPEPAAEKEPEEAEEFDLSEEDLLWLYESTDFKSLLVVIDDVIEQSSLIPTLKRQARSFCSKFNIYNLGQLCVLSEQNLECRSGTSLNQNIKEFFKNELEARSLSFGLLARFGRNLGFKMRKTENRNPGESFPAYIEGRKIFTKLLQASWAVARERPNEKNSIPEFNP